MNDPRVGVASEVGQVRDHNEDAYLVRPPLFAVADGMGGHAAGEVAAQLALESLETSLVGRWDGEDALRSAIVAANQVVYERSNAPGPQHGMGTTCALLVLADGMAYLGHVGDSRIYRLRNGELEQLTRDHTLLFDMVDQDLVSADQAMMDTGWSPLTRALGGGEHVDVDVSAVQIEPGDRFLLCSDGLSGMVADEEIRVVLTEFTDPQGAAERLASAADAAGGEDNVTALVVDP